MIVTRAQAEDFSHAHAEGLHAEHAREGCPDCDGRELGAYPPFAEGDRVERRLPGETPETLTVLRCQRDRYGWDVNVQPGNGEPVWIGAGQLRPV